MATYIKGVTDVVPKLSPVQVDYNLLSKSLGAIQDRYNKGFDQVKSMYTSLINSELSSSDNQQFRSEYLKKADAALAQLSGVDLANPGNISQAMTLFDPLLEDKQYTKDLYLTKVQNSQIQKMLSVKNSTDKDVRAQYNPVMEQYLGIGKERLTQMKRDDGSIDKATAHMYSPWEDPVEYALKLAKDTGLKITQQTPNGMYMVTSINGDKSYGPFKNWFNNVIGNKFDNQFRIEAEVDTDKAVKGLMSSNPSLTKDAAMQQLAEGFSNRYVELYNDQIDDVKSRIAELDRKKRVLQNRYPTGIPANIADEVVKMKAEKDQLTENLNRYIKEKGSDDDFRQRAVQIYLNNPASTYVSEIKDRYAKNFASVQSLSDATIKYEADQVALQTYLQNDRQAFEWAKMQAEEKNERERMGLKFGYDLQLEYAKGTLKEQAAGATVGQREDIGALSTEQYYQKLVLDSHAKGTEPFANDILLAVAANLTVGKNGIISYKQGEEVDMPLVQSSILNLGKGARLSSSQQTELKKYLDMVSPGNKLNMANISFPDIQNILTGAIRKNSNNYPDYGKPILKTVYNANVARQQYADYWDESRQHLTSVYNSDPEMRKYIRVGALGGLFPIYSEINKLDKKERDDVYRKLIPRYEKYSGQTAKQMQTIQLNPSDPTKFDYSIFNNVINNAEKIGVTIINSKGNREFVAYEDEQIAKLRNITLGEANLSKVFDVNATYARKIENGVEYVKVTIPVKRTATGKGGSVATTMGFDLNGQIEQNNKLEFLVPLGKADNLAPSDITLTDPITGQKMVRPNELRSLLTGLTGQSLLPSSQSWVTKGGLLEGKPSAFPAYLQSYINSGYLYVQGNDIYAKYVTDSGEHKIHNLTNALNITYNDLKYNPAEYDSKIRNLIENGLENYKEDNLVNAHNQINNNAISGKTNVKMVSWKTINW